MDMLKETGWFTKHEGQPGGWPSKHEAGLKDQASVFAFSTWRPL